MKLGLGLALALVAARVLNIGFFVQHGATNAMRSLSLRHPFRSVRLLVTSRQWMLGYATGWVGWGIYIAALSLAPLSLVQAVAAGGNLERDAQLECACVDAAQPSAVDRRSRRRAGFPGRHGRGQRGDAI